jgi:hypothetical protein
MILLLIYNEWINENGLIRQNFARIENVEGV